MDGRLRGVRPTELAMARELRWWLAAALLACGAVAMAYLPPRGGAREAGVRDEPFRQTPARLRAQALAAQWRAANLALRLPEYRRRLQPELLRRRERDAPGPTLLVEAPDSLAAFAHEVLSPALDTVARHLRLGVTKVSVGLVVDLRRTVSANPAETPTQDFAGPAYLFPDASDRPPCVALPPAWLWTGTLLAVKPPARNPRVEDWLRSGLGPCAFYAAYGAPGKGVRRWLTKRGYDLAGSPAWDGAPPERRESFVMYQDGTRWRWSWWSVYRFPVTAIACLGGRTMSCEAAVLWGAEETTDDSPPQFLESDTRGWWRSQRVLYSDRYLAEVAREVGHDRFLRFWSSTEPVDTALAAALKMPVGEWTVRWQRRFVPRLPLGAAPPTSSAALGILLAGLAVVAVALDAGSARAGRSVGAPGARAARAGHGVTRCEGSRAVRRGTRRRARYRRVGVADINTQCGGLLLRGGHLRRGLRAPRSRTVRPCEPRPGSRPRERKRTGGAAHASPDGVVPREGRDGALSHESMPLRHRPDHSPTTLMITRFLRCPSHSP